MQSSQISIKQKLSKINYDRDCLIICQPDRGITFHIPEGIKDLVRIDEELNPYVFIPLLVYHLMKYSTSDPTIIEFISKMKSQIFLDLEDLKE
jgi:hypothetical protein